MYCLYKRKADNADTPFHHSQEKNNPFNMILSYSEAFQYADVLRSLSQC